MKMSGLLSRRGHDLPGVAGTARFLAAGADAPRRIGPDDIVVADLDRMTAATARAIADAPVAGVVHTGASGTPSIPRSSYRILAASTVPVFTGIDGGALKDGQRIRIDEGIVYRGNTELADGHEADSDELLDSLDDAESTMVDDALGHYANAVEFLRLEHPLVLDGEGIPQVDVDLAGRHVVVVRGDEASREQLGRLRPFIREYRPVLVGVGAGADVLRDARLDADLIVADPTEVSDAALVDGADLVVPADRDGRAPGLERAGDLGVTATTFPAAATDRDMALLIAHHGGAAMIVVTGDDRGVESALEESAPPSSVIVDQAVGSRLVHADACASLYRSRGAGVWIALLLLLALAAVAVFVVAQGAAPELLHAASRYWNDFAVWVQGLFK